MEWMYEVGLLPHKDWLEELVIAQSDDAATPPQCLGAWEARVAQRFYEFKEIGYTAGRA